MGGVVPSIAIKVFRDGELSANIVALNTQQPQTETTNPFFLPLTNQVNYSSHTRTQAHCSLLLSRSRISFNLSLSSCLVSPVL